MAVTDCIADRTNLYLIKRVYSLNKHSTNYTHLYRAYE